MADVDTKRDRALDFIGKTGPVLPIQISKELNIDTMFSGAVLSELVNEGKLKVTTHLRVGGSPVYFIEGQEAKLEDYMGNLNERDIGTIRVLKEKGIMNDKDCTPLQRVSFRIVKDFAKSIVLKRDNGEKEVFWRYYLIDEDAAKEKILEMVKVRKIRKDAQKTVEEFKEEPSLGKNVREERGFSEKKAVREEREYEEMEKPLERAPEVKEVPRVKKVLGDSVKEFFRVNGITVWEEKVIRKGKDVNYIVSFDSRVGNVKYFAKFRDKKRITEGDISLAFNEAGNFPLLFLSRGELTKPGKRLLEGDLKGVVFKKIQ
ncbi:TPA: hypothetical protein HA278_03730 [Candidatus Woesearchaeota archaeon]|nr:hypothetical protein [Candidatus Woesearchaeota archaeon]